jgi:hypothetical protein
LKNYVVSSFFALISNLQETNTMAFQHPDVDFLQEALDTVMIKRELMADVRLYTRMRHFEVRYERYERLMKELYRHEDDWAVFDPTEYEY